MDNSQFTLTHEQQQQAVEEIQKLAREEGISMGEAIQIVARRLREAHKQGHSESQK